MPTIFTKIIEGSIPSYKIFEDEYTFAFLDIHPINPGHTLIVPKIEIDYFIDVPDPYYSRVFQNAKIIGKAIREATHCLRVCTWIEGMQVPHFHYHVCPFFHEQEFWGKTSAEVGPEEMKSIQEKIVQHLDLTNP